MENLVGASRSFSKIHRTTFFRLKQSNSPDWTRLMNNYDLSRLNDKEFESLCADLLTESEGVSIERFKSGRDGGVDGRFFSPDDGEVIIQCKHWIKTGLKPLLRHLKKVELPKIKALSPKRYILMVSTELSRADKSGIVEDLSPYIQADSDVIGAEDISDMLGRYSEVERRHYKLWLSSANVLMTLNNMAIIGRSDFKLTEIQKSSHKYVHTKNHAAAFSMLEDKGSIIITGEAGIGKTTLAEQLCLKYATSGFKVCCIEHSMSEAEGIFIAGEKQVYYFDDFLGRNYFDAINGHEDSHVLGFVRRIEKDSSKRFILTSRTTILNRGKQLSDRFDIYNVNRNEYEIEIDSISPIEKAEILYNHIWFSCLNEGHIDELYIDRRYLSVVKHRNFNPRLISFITDSSRLDDVPPEHYWEFICRMLDNPSEVWADVFERQIDDFARVAVSIVAYNGKAMQEREFHESFSDAVVETTETNLSRVGFVFEQMCRLTVGTLLTRSLDVQNGTTFYDLFNPAVGDYLYNRATKFPQEISFYFKHLNTVESLGNLDALCNANKLDEEIYKDVLSSLVTEKLNNEHISVDYGIHLCLRASIEVSDRDPVKDALQRYVTTFLETPLAAKYIEEICLILNWYILEYGSTDAAAAHISECLKEASSHQQFVTISRTIYLSGGVLDTLTDEFEKKLLEYWENCLQNELWESGEFHDYIEDNQESEVYDNADGLVQSKMGEIAIKIDNENIVDSIMGYFDASLIISENQNNFFDEPPIDRDDYISHGGATDVNSAIDDLFDRS